MHINTNENNIKHLEELLLEAKVVCHPFVIGELACGNIKNRSEILALLIALHRKPSTKEMVEAYTKKKSTNLRKDEKEHGIECKATKTYRQYSPF